ncbi:TolC family protein [bacterium]|nr:TolC family protein [bacterium]
MLTDFFGVIRTRPVLRRFWVLTVLITTFSFPLSAIDIDPELLSKLKLVESKGEMIVEVSMETLLSLALERSTVADVLEINRQIAEEALAAAREIYNPVFTTSLGVSHIVSPSGTNFTGSVYGISRTVASPYIGFSASPYLSFSASDITALSATWAKKNTFGITYKLSYQKIANQTSLGSIQTEGDPFKNWAAVDDPLYIDNLAAAISIPIFQDWGDINRLPEFKSEIALAQTEMQSRKSKLELLSLVANIYWDLVGVQENIQTLDSSIELAEQFLQDSRTRYKMGVLDIIEVKQSESRLAAVKQSKLQEVFKRSQIEDQIRAALNLSDLPYGYKATEKMTIRKNIPGFKALLEKVYETNQDIQLLKSAERMNDLARKEAENQADANLDLNLQYQLNGYGEDYGKALGGISETKLHDYYIGLSWVIPLFDKVTPQKINQTALERARLNLQIENQKSQLKVELQAILRNLKLSTQGIRLAQNTVELMEQLLRKEIEKFNLGDNTSFRISQVQQDLTDARKNEILARIQYEKAYLSLLVITEKIFPTYHLKG